MSIFLSQTYNHLLTVQTTDSAVQFHPALIIVFSLKLVLEGWNQVAVQSSCSYSALFSRYFSVEYKSSSTVFSVF